MERSRREIEDTLLASKGKRTGHIPEEPYLKASSYKLFVHRDDSKRRILPILK
jgi:hypothetical protein